MKYDISISGMIGYEVTGDYIRYMLKGKQGKRVDVRICSLGGRVDDALDIYTQFREHGDCHAHFVGMNASAATIIAMGCKTVDIVKSGLLLIHNGAMEQFVFGSYNKEQLDELIASLGKSRETLSTVDDVIASIYADRCGKKLEDVQEKMKVAAWIKASDAKDFGLVDSIRKDVDDDERSATNFFNAQITKESLTNLGLPLPSCMEEEHPTNSQSILQKVAQLLGLSKPESNSNPATKTESTMLKIFNSVASLLNVEGFAVNDKDNIEFSQEQLMAMNKALEDKDASIKSLKDEIEALKNAEPKSKPEDVAKINDLETKLTAAQEDIKAKDAQIENLKKAPAVVDETPAPQGAEEATGADFVNLFK